MRFKKNPSAFGYLLLFTVLFSIFLGLKIVTRSDPPPSIKKSTNSSYLFETGNQIFSAKIGSATSKSPYIVFNNRDKSSVSLHLNNSASEKIIKKNNQIIYQNVGENIDFVYSTLVNGLKEEIILHQPVTKAEYTFTLTTSNAKPRQVGDHAYSPYFFDDQNNYQFHIEKPFAIDAKGNRTEDITLSLRRSTKEKNTYQLHMAVSSNWLNDKNRAYPITIDPTVIHDTSSEFATGVLNRVKDTGSGSVPSLETYYQPVSSDINTVGLWHLDESSGNALDSSGNSNTATPNGTTIVTGLFGNSRSFNGTSDALTVTVAASSPLDLDYNPVTLEAWIKITSITGSNQHVISRGTVGANGYGLLITTSGTVNLGSHGGGNFSGSTILTTGVWHHIAGVINGADSAIYVNGKLDATGTVDIVASTLDAHIGSTWDGAARSLFFGGQIDEVRISNVVRSAEEIRLAAQRRPYSIFTSDVIDFSVIVAAWNSLSWNEIGVTTGDGETINSSSGLVAQWNFNETSGTTANNDAEGTSCSGTPANCDGTLTGFDSTASQDADPDSSWTSNNKRWGAGALQFDGVNSVVTTATNTPFHLTGDFTLEAWYKTSDEVNSQMIMSFGAAGDWLYLMNIDTCKLYQSNSGSGYLQASGPDRQADGFWHHAACVVSGNSVSMYIDGKLVDTDTSTTGTRDVSSAGTFTIGKFTNTTSLFFTGTIDSARVYTRVLSAAEIMNNYNAGSIELQTRVGSTATPDDGTWEEWRPITGETQILSEDTHLTDSLISYWKLDESSGTRYDSVGTNDLTANGTGGVGTGVGIINNAADFETTETDYLEVLDNTSLSTGDIDYTVTAWVKLESTGSQSVIVAKSGATFATREYLLYYTGTNLGFIIYDSSGNVACSTTGTNLGALSASVWYFVVAWHDASANTCNIQGNNGTANSSSETAVPFDNTGQVRIGNWGPTSLPFDGLIDEVGFWKRKLTADEKTSLYSSGVPKFYPDGTDPANLQKPGLISSTDTNLKIEGSGSQKFVSFPQVDNRTIGLWHLEETSGSGAYLKDATTNARNATPTGTGPIKGIAGKGRSFSGSDFVTITGETTEFSINTFSVSAWIKTTSTSTPQIIVDNRDSANDGWLFYLASNLLTCRYNATDVAATTYIVPYTWYHVACTSDGATLKVSVNGVQENSGAIAGSISETTSTTIGGRSFTTPANTFQGIIDEVQISNAVRSTNEISEAYRLGRDYLVNKAITSTDLSGKTSLPFYIAADRAGTYLTATIGESNFANFLQDSNTRGLWHLSERSGTGTYIGDSSGLGNNLSVTGADFSDGKIGKGRTFISSNTDLLSCTDANCGGTTKLDPGTSDWSMGAWIKTEKVPGQFIISKGGTAGQFAYNLQLVSGGSPRYILHNTSDGAWMSASGSARVNDGNWHFIVGTYDGTNISVYSDGVLLDTTTTTSGTQVTNSSNNFQIGARTADSTSYFNGQIDEVFVTAYAPTADEIRQAYEIGLRTHPITIDFASAISHTGPLSGSSDLTFTLMATPSGTTNPGDNIYKGDKIIIRENINGTEYIAQGTVDSVNVSTGATTVSSWDGFSTFPTGGFTPDAEVFKWQREYWPLDGGIIDTSLNAITNITLRTTDSNEARSIWLDDFKSNTGYLTTPTGSTITSSIGNRYLQYRIINTSVDYDVSATVSAVTVDYTPNASPNIPTLDSPADTATGVALSPQLKTTATDTDSDYIRYKIQICTNLAMTTGCQTFDQTSSQTGWSGQNTQSSTAYTSGTQGTYTIQTPLTANTVYYWRSYAIDPAGTNAFGSTQATPYSFTTNASPNIPTLDSPADTATGVALSPQLKTTATDTDSDYIRYKIQICTNLAMTTGCQTFDQTSSQTGWSGQNTQSSTAYTSGTQGTYTVQTPLTEGTTYYWRSYAIDPAGTNAFGSTQATPYSFTTNASPNIPTLIAPSNGATGVSITPVFQTSATDDDSDYLRYKILLCLNELMTLSCQTIDQTVSQTGWSGQNTQSSTAYTSGTTASHTIQSALLPNTQYFWKTSAIDPAGTNAFGSTQASPYSFNTLSGPAHPSECTVTKNSTNTEIVVNWTDNANNEDGYQVWRRVNGGAPSQIGGSLPANTEQYTDSTVIDGNSYMYLIRAFLFDGSNTLYSAFCETATSNTGTGSFMFEGLRFDGVRLN